MNFCPTFTKFQRNHTTFRNFAFPSIKSTPFFVYIDVETKTTLEKLAESARETTRVSWQSRMNNSFVEPDTVKVVGTCEHPMFVLLVEGENRHLICKSCGLKERSEKITT